MTPNPKTSGGARWNYLAAWGYALKQPGGSEATAKDLVTKIYKNTKVLDSGARGSTTTFVERGIGDVLIAWENEAYLALKELGPDKFEIVTPTISILAEPTVAVVDKNVDKQRHAQGRRRVPRTISTRRKRQEIAAKNYYRPRDAKVAEKYKANFGDGEAVHDRRGVRRLGQGPEDALRRRRHVRPDLPAGKQELTIGHAALGECGQRSPRVPVDSPAASPNLRPLAAGQS